MVTKVLRRPIKQRGTVDVCKRWQRKFLGTFSLERITPLDYCAVQVAGFSRGAADALELVEEGFELLIADTKILDRHAVGYEALAVALRNVASETQFLRQNAPVLTIPMHTPAADTGSRQKRPQLPIRQAAVAGRMANRQGFARQILKQLVAYALCQLVGNARIGEVQGSVAVLAPLEGNDFQTGLREFHAHSVKEGPFFPGKVPG